LERGLENATEHAAAITLDNTTLLHKLEAQQKAILDQQAKFMTLLSQTDQAPLSPPTAPCQRRNRSNGTPPTEGRRNPHFCNSCKKDGVYHEDEECFALDKNKDKRPDWSEPKKGDPVETVSFLNDSLLKNLVKANKHKSSAPHPYVCSLNYWSPLACPETRVRFNLLPLHCDKNSAAWRHRMLRSISPLFRPTTKYKQQHRPTL
jgi:hypothetical protein